MLRLEGTGAEAGPDVSPIGHVEVAIGVIDQTRTGGPTTAAQYFLIPEPRCGVFLVRSRSEPWIGHEVARSPLPHVADHLAAPVGTVTIGQRPNVDTTQSLRVKVCSVGHWLLISPRIQPLAI